MAKRQYPEEYIAYLAEYNGSRDFFECHEIMEEYWKENPKSPEIVCWLVLIRVSVCLYHARRGNWTGAAKLMAKAAKEARGELERFERIGLDGRLLTERLETAASLWLRPDTAAYADIELPIIDDRLLGLAKQKCAELGYEWGIGGLAAGDDVVHRHLTRDRSGVVAARAESAERKSLSRGNPETRSRR